MQVKAHYEGVAEGLMKAMPAGGGLAANALAALQAASADGAPFNVLQQRHAPSTSSSSTSSLHAHHVSV